MTAAIRRVSYAGNRDLTELAGDVEQAFAKQVAFQTISFTRDYAEPMYIAFPRKPIGVLLIDLREDADPETANAFAAGVNWSFTSQGIRVDEIQGPLVGTRYRYAFLVVG